MSNVPLISIPPLRRVGLIGDVHGEHEALEAALRFLAEEREPLDAFLCTGDLPAKQGIGDADRCCALLQDAKAYVIRGNHDRWQIENEEVRALLQVDEPLSFPSRLFLRNLPRMLEFPTIAGPLLLCHGAGGDDLSGIYPGGDAADIEHALESYGLPGPYRFMVSGHTHRRMVRSLPSGLTLLNPGTLRWEENPCFAIADFETGFVQFYDLMPFTNVHSPGARFAL